MTKEQFLAFFDTPECMELEFPDGSSLTTWPCGMYMMYQDELVSAGEGQMMTEDEAFAYCNAHLPKNKEAL